MEESKASPVFPNSKSRFRQAVEHQKTLPEKSGGVLFLVRSKTFEPAAYGRKAQAQLAGNLLTGLACLEHGLGSWQVHLVDSEVGVHWFCS